LRGYIQNDHLMSMRIFTLIMNKIFMSSKNHKENGYIIWPRSAFANRVAAIPCFISYEKWASWMEKKKKKKKKNSSTLHMDIQGPIVGISNPAEHLTIGLA
jgi:hypothetical protein